MTTPRETVAKSRGGTFTVPGRAVPKARPRLGRGGHIYTPTATKRYEEAVAWSALASGLRLARGDRVALEVDFHLCPVAGDVDNRLKTIMDGLQRAFPAWDDRDVVDVTGRQIARKSRDEQHTTVCVEVLR